MTPGVPARSRHCSTLPALLVLMASQPLAAPANIPGIDLHPAPHAVDQVENGSLGQIVVREQTAVLHLLRGHKQVLVCDRNVEPVRYPGLHDAHSVRSLDVQRELLASDDLDQNLHDQGLKDRGLPG
eukprot:CAMPEP_0197658272 /NCGR_PEP_ID=MMETSP1338-20131121/45140_1 /TAXON_ID=43686 ORGANISM="Pelagodinium beii, Strain RCC1491" /NCGR_SAMPLE_ID=MMETSP1338 /ASSEMBLY_ACC=CAM_ASM_000754 /LENGTH=126 /DNA_ID=CAMNT_0043234829 /DNA_START=127 /DNA_END=508 /DNA_ORIENTATION=+